LDRHFGTPNGPVGLNRPACAEKPDFDGDGNVGITDFLELLANWGPCL